MPRPSSRARILDALEEIVIEHGVAAVTLDAVCARAGVSKGGLLYHFDSRQALFEGLLARLDDEMTELFGGLPDDVPAMVERYLLDAGKPGKGALLYRALLATSRADLPEPADPRLRIERLFVRFYEPLQKIPDEVTRTHVQAVADGLFVRAMLGLPPLPDPMVRELARRTLAGT
jgi:AcrR family transcriptional regulator